MSKYKAEGSCVIYTGREGMEMIEKVFEDLYGDKLKEQQLEQEQKNYYDVGGLFIPKLKVE